MAEVKGVLGARRYAEHTWADRTEEWAGPAQPALAGCRAEGRRQRDEPRVRGRALAVQAVVLGHGPRPPHGRHVRASGGRLLAFVNRLRQTATGKAKPNTVRMELTVLSGPNRRRPEGDVSRPDGMHQSASGDRKGAP